MRQFLRDLQIATSGPSMKLTLIQVLWPAGLLFGRHTILHLHLGQDHLQPPQIPQEPDWPRNQTGHGRNAPNVTIDGSFLCS